MLIPTIECLKSLSFLNMDQREYLVEGAATNTCTWLLNHGEYRTWLGRRHALLWIVGKPGAGKSTLMRYALQRASHSSDVVASFFFFGRGSDLQKSSCGLFRSLLHQLLDQIPEMLSHFLPIYEKKCKSKQKSESDIQWHETELREFLEQRILSASRDRPIRIYMDALDEAGTDVAEKVIAYFEELIERLRPTTAGFAVCFSCRHYPVLVPKNVLKIYVEKENHQDIATYVRQRLTKYQLSDPTEALELEQEIIWKASRIFQWVVLIMPVIIEADKNGASVRKIRQKIKKIPGQLGDLYGLILSRIEDQKRAAQLMQWVCFALQPLSLKELRYAMVVDITNDCTSLEECRGSVDFAETDEQMLRTVTSLSGGLAETVEYENQQTVRFIHQSVNDYLIERGLQKLHPSFFDDVNHYLSKSGLPSLDASLSDNVAGLAQFRISRSCVKYFTFEEVWEEIKRTGILGEIKTQDIKRELLGRFPFLQYSGKNSISHAQRVETQRIPQADLLSLCRWPSGHAIRCWAIALYLADALQSREAWGADLPHIASRYGLSSVIEAIFKSGESFDLNSKDQTGSTALSLAAKRGQEGVVRLLIKRDDVDINSQNDEGETPLLSATEVGYEAIVRLLIQRNDIDINSKDKWERTPLSLAIQEGSEAIVRLLIQRDDVDTKSKDYQGQTSLSRAISCGHEAIVQLLIEKDLKSDPKKRLNQTLLIWAARRGYETVVRFLLERDDIDIHLKNKWGETSLSWAAMNGHKVIVQLLMERGADIDSRDVLGRTPLSVARGRGHEAAVQLMNKRDNAKVDPDPLSWAIADGLEALIRLSIELDLIDVDLKQRWEQDPSSWTTGEKKGAYWRLYTERHHAKKAEHFEE